MRRAGLAQRMGPGQHVEGDGPQAIPSVGTRYSYYLSTEDAMILTLALKPY